MSANRNGRKRRANFDYAAQWADNGEEEMTLPSGKVVIVRTPDLSRMAQQGTIPNHMIAAVEKFILGGMNMLIREVPGITAEGQEPGKALTRTAELNYYIDAMCVAALVEPTFVFEGEKGGIPISAMSADDKFAIWDWGVGLTAGLARFRADRSGPVGDVGTASSGEDVRENPGESSGIEQSA